MSSYWRLASLLERAPRSSSDHGGPFAQQNPSPSALRELAHCGLEELGVDPAASEEHKSFSSVLGGKHRNCRNRLEREPVTPGRSMSSDGREVRFVVGYQRRIAHARISEDAGAHIDGCHAQQEPTGGCGERMSGEVLIRDEGNALIHDPTGAGNVDDMASKQNGGRCPSAETLRIRVDVECCPGDVPRCEKLQNDGGRPDAVPVVRPRQPTVLGERPDDVLDGRPRDTESTGQLADSRCGIRPSDGIEQFHDPVDTAVGAHTPSLPHVRHRSPEHWLSPKLTS